LTPAHTFKHTHTQRYPLTHTHSHKHTHSSTRTFKSIHSYTHTHTHSSSSPPPSHTHTHTLSLFYFLTGAHHLHQHVFEVLEVLVERHGDHVLHAARDLQQALGLHVADAHGEHRHAVVAQLAGGHR